MLLPVCLMLIGLLARDVTAGGVVDLTNQERQEMLDAHNHFRRLAKSATNMRLMHWDCGLERFAANYLQNCMYAHSTQSSRINLEGFWYVGENLKWGASSVEGEKLPKNITAAIKEWYDEVKGYDYRDNYCYKEPCGHYTQVVWAESHALGCAMTRCTDGLNYPMKSQVILQCVYGPGGNVNDARPYKETGTKCSGMNQIGGLCSDTSSAPSLPQC